MYTIASFPIGAHAWKRPSAARSNRRVDNKSTYFSWFRSNSYQFQQWLWLLIATFGLLCVQGELQLIRSLLTWQANGTNVHCKCPLCILLDINMASIWIFELLPATGSIWQTNTQLLFLIDDSHSHVFNWNASFMHSTKRVKFYRFHFGRE